MNNPELDSILKKARLPEIPAEALETFSGRITARHQRGPAPRSGERVGERTQPANELVNYAHEAQGDSSPSTPHTCGGEGRGEEVPNTLMGRALFRRRPARNFFPRPAWAFGLAAACVLLAFAITRWHGRMEAETLPQNDILAGAKFTAETLALFPNRLRAIIEDAHGLRLDLSDTDNVPASPPLYIRVCDGAQCSSFVTFSGQQIQVAGQKVTVLADARGGIILEGDQFVWTSAEPAHAASRMKIAAKILAPVAM